MVLFKSFRAQGVLSHFWKGLGTLDHGDLRRLAPLPQMTNVHSALFSPRRDGGEMVGEHFPQVGQGTYGGLFLGKLPHTF